MSTITPTSDSLMPVDRTALAVGDLVLRSADGLAGRVVGVNFEGVPTQVFVQWVNSTSSAASVLQLRRL